MCREKEGVNICVKKLMLYFSDCKRFPNGINCWRSCSYMLLINNISQVVPFLLHGSPSLISMCF